MLLPPAAPSSCRGGKGKKKPGEIKVYVLGQPQIKHEDAAAAAAAAAGAAKTFRRESLGGLMANQ